MAFGNFWRTINAYDIPFFIIHQFHYNNFDAINVVNARITLYKWYFNVNCCTTKWSCIVNKLE